jgi:hypothetical protein
MVKKILKFTFFSFFEKKISKLWKFTKKTLVMTLQRFFFFFFERNAQKKTGPKLNSLDLKGLVYKLSNNNKITIFLLS